MCNIFCFNLNVNILNMTNSTTKVLHNETTKNIYLTRKNFVTKTNYAFNLGNFFRITDFTENKYHMFWHSIFIY